MEHPGIFKCFSILAISVESRVKYLCKSNFISTRTRKELMQAMVSCAFLQIYHQSVQLKHSIGANSTTVFVQFCHSICANSSAVFVHCLKQYLYNYTSVFVQVLVTRVCSRRWWVVGRPRRKPTKSQLANTRFQVHCSKRKHGKLEILGPKTP